MKNKIKIILVDDHKMLLSSLSNVLNNSEMVEIVDSFSDPLEALMNIDHTKCDVVVSDVRMKQMNGLILAKELKRKFGNKIKIILISGFYTEEYHKNALDIGVHAFLPKESSDEQLLSVIKQVTLNNVLIPFDLLKVNNEKVLSETEVKVLLFIAQEKTNEDIAQMLYISKRTVEHHLTSIFRKLDVQTRVGAVVKGIEKGIIST
ncbi:response regulator [Niallia sp. 01092]|uniref:response regulator n=2 Tax=Niallia TaxID=2837506 RepID=UPI003FD42C2A